MSVVYIGDGLVCVFIAQVMAFSSPSFNSPLSPSSSLSLPLSSSPPLCFLDELVGDKVHVFHALSKSDIGIASFNRLEEFGPFDAVKCGCVCCHDYCVVAICCWW